MLWAREGSKWNGKWNWKFKKHNSRARQLHLPFFPPFPSPFSLSCYKSRNCVIKKKTFSVFKKAFGRRARRRARASGMSASGELHEENREKLARSLAAPSLANTASGGCFSSAFYIFSLFLRGFFREYPLWKWCIKYMLRPFSPPAPEIAILKRSREELFGRWVKRRSKHVKLSWWIHEWMWITISDVWCRLRWFYIKKCL